MDTTMEVIVKLLSQMHARAEIYGSTMMQKIMYILKHEYGDEVAELRDIRFKLHYYGPFSRQVSNALDNLTFLGLLDTRVERVIDFLRYRYRLTETGRNVAQDLYESDNRRELFQRMAERAEQLNRRSLRSVISDAYRLAEDEGL